MNQYNFMSVSEFADRHQISRQATVKAIRKKRIFAFKVGNFWVIGGNQNLPPRKTKV